MPYKDPEKNREYQLEWYHAHRKQRNISHKEWKKKNPVRVYLQGVRSNIKRKRERYEIARSLQDSET